MPKTLSGPPRRSVPAPNRKRWTRHECDLLVDKELLTGRYELVDGAIISKMGQKPRHSFVVILFHNWLQALFGGLFVQCHATIDVGDAETVGRSYNEPEPDLAVTRQPCTAYPENHAGPEDLLLVAEVSDTTLRFDRTTKALLYARAEINEFWVVDIAGRRIFVHRRPSPEGYAEIVEYYPIDMISTLARPEVSIRVAELLPPE
jgi:Uma2 family endonuclease